MGLKRLIFLIPEVKAPQQELSTREKTFWTMIVFIAYSIITSIPLLGVLIGQGDPFAFMRLITASSHGSLGELGIGPILVAGLVMQIFLGFKIIDMKENNLEEQKFLNSTFKALAILCTVLGAIFFFLGESSGYDLYLSDALIILIQLIGAGIIIIYLDEMIQKGWGYGSGIALFIVGGVTLEILNSLISPQSFLEGHNGLISNRGILVAFCAWLRTEGPIAAIQALFFRYDPVNGINLPSYSLFALICTILMILVWNILLPTKIPLKNQEGKDKSITIRSIIFFLVLPIVFTSILFSTVSLFAKIVWRINGGEGTNSIFVNILGSFRYDPSTHQYIPSGGLIFYLTPPRTLIGDLGVLNPQDPFSSIVKAIIYAIAFTIVTTVFFNRMLRRTGVLEKHSIINNRTQDDSSFHSMVRFWGILFTLIIVFSEFLGVLGSGVGLFLCVSILNQYFEIIRNQKEPKPKIIGFYV